MTKLVVSYLLSNTVNERDKTDKHYLPQWRRNEINIAGTRLARRPRPLSRIFYSVSAG